MSVQPLTVATSLSAELVAKSPSGTQSDTTAIFAGEAGSAALEQKAVAPVATLEEIKTALQEVESALRPVAGALNFSLDDESGQTLIKVVDRETEEVIRQIPSEELVRISKALDTLRGLLLNQEA